MNTLKAIQQYLNDHGITNTLHNNYTYYQYILVEPSICIQQDSNIPPTNNPHKITLWKTKSGVATILSNIELDNPESLPEILKIIKEYRHT